MGGGREVQRKGIYLWLINVNTSQKPTEYCKAIILQLKINKFLKIAQFYGSQRAE